MKNLYIVSVKSYEINRTMQTVLTARCLNGTKHLIYRISSTCLKVSMTWYSCHNVVSEWKSYFVSEIFHLFVIILCLYFFYEINLRELMLEMVVYAERVPKISKGDMWRKSEVLRWDDLNKFPDRNALNFLMGQLFGVSLQTGSMLSQITLCFLYNQHHPNSLSCFPIYPSYFSLLLFTLLFLLLSILLDIISESKNFKNKTYCRILKLLTVI